MKFTNREGRLRFYDGCSGPYYLQQVFDSGDFDGPLGMPTVEEILQLNRGRMDANAHYVRGGDEPLMEFLPFTFSAALDDSSRTGALKDWLKGMNDAAATKVNGHTLRTTKGTTQRNGSNNNPTFADSNKIASNVQVLFDTSLGGGSGSDLLIAYNEVWFPLGEQRVAESDAGLILSLSGRIYGTIAITQGGAFTTGTSVV